MCPHRAGVHYKHADRHSWSSRCFVQIIVVCKFKKLSAILGNGSIKAQLLNTVTTAYILTSLSKRSRRTTGLSWCLLHLMVGTQSRRAVNMYCSSTGKTQDTSQLPHTSMMLGNIICPALSTTYSFTSNVYTTLFSLYKTIQTMMGRERKKWASVQVQNHCPGTSKTVTNHWADKAPLPHSLMS